jgi:leucyl aminopeptidase
MQRNIADKHIFAHQRHFFDGGSFMFNLHNLAGSLTETKAQALVLFSFQNDKKPMLDIKQTGVAGALEKLEKARDEGRFKAGNKETVFFRSVGVDGFEHLLIVGLGEKKKVTEETLRVASAVAFKTLSKEKVISAAFCIQNLRSFTKTAEGAGRAVSEGVLLAAYKYDDMKSKPKDDGESKKDLKDIYLVLADKVASKKFGTGVEVGRILAEGTNFARDLGNAPSNYLTPKIFEEKVRETIRGTSIKFHALDKKQIQALKMGCLLGVNKGSGEEPRFLVMEYNGGKKGAQPLILVGKGITFDTGGISIKPSAAMEEMKFDMCGGAAVSGAILAIAKLKLKINVVALVPATENMPGGNAIKPGDVLVAMSGKTVEVNNTDAEGRLVLADALVYACEKYKPALIVDAATLTGACVVALGNVYSGFFSTDKNLVKQIQMASESSGEKLWQLPLNENYVDDMKGTYADLSNMGGAKGGGASQGAAFLSQFVKEEVPWAHFDIAGSAWNTGSRYPYNPDKGASGAAVRLFTQLAMDTAK